ncbi:MAG TPA: PAS domain S-box protein [Candidatus Sulfopaludibacter sp.]|nr:PAS domain S-box protein [Candidatus Sulfopaludibacter sp.]
MSRVTVIWSMVASACLTLASVHLVVWWNRRTAWANLLFSLTAVATAAFAGCELWMMRAETPEEFASAVRWIHVPTWAIVVALVGFVRFYLRAGRPWLGWTVCGLRTVALLLNFLTGQNLNYREVTGLRHIEFFGESISVAAGLVNSWMLIGQFSLLLLLVFVADAMLTVWRRGDRRQALVTGGSIMLWVLVGMVQATLVATGIVHWPITTSLFFIPFLVAMGYEISRDALRAAQLSQELRQNEERMTLAANAAKLRYWEWDMVRDEFWTTNYPGTRSGPRQSGRRGFDQFLLLLHPDDREPVSHAIAKSMNGNGDYECEYRVLLPNGATRWTVSRGQVEFNVVGKPVRMRGVSTDITARKWADEKFRLMVEASPGGIVLVNGQGRIVLVNSTAEKLFGYVREELIGQAADMLVPERFHGGHPAHRVGFFAAPQARDMGAGRELFARRKDGTEFPVEISLSPIQSAEGLLVLTAIVDVTARKRAEVEALRQRAELTHVTRVSTVGALASSLAHELNQPLSAILSNAQAASRFLAAATPDLAEVRGALEDIAQDTKRAGEVIRQVRSLVRRGEPNLTPLDLNRVISDVVRLLHSDMLIRKVRVALELDPALRKAGGDSIQLQQVILNLMLNAFDAMKDLPESKRSVILRTRQLDADTIRVEVSDCGTGISPERLFNLFEPFHSSKQDGLGLGLAISHSIIEAHKGRLWAENNPYHGATFYFTLPVQGAELDLH